MMLPQSRWQLRFLLILGAALGIVFLPVAFGLPMVNSGDLHVYSAEMDVMFRGEVPYLEFQFEHLPLAILPMAATQVIANLTGLPFAYPFMAISLAMTFVTGVLVARIGEDLGVGDAGRRWVIMVAPMLLIIPFRIDALSVMLTVAAVFYAIERHDTASLAATIGAILSKGWPVILVATDWWRGERRRARAVVVFTVALGVLLIAMPGFRAARSFVGVHEETLSGTLVVVARLLTGHDPQIVHSAGAEYVVAGTWAVLLNLAIGGAITLASLTVLRRAFSWRGGVALIAAMTYGVLLASPLLSAQFILWPIPFVALTGSRRGRVLLTTAATISVALTAIWDPGAMWWHTGWLIRNFVLVGAAVQGVLDARRVAATYEPKPALAGPAV
ncbi:MAG: hypothetical protein O7E49_12445 [Gemmatimonadetes bacterium]|nr:hypothetical protein [Gemmatimonadota bacterium]